MLTSLARLGTSIFFSIPGNKFLKFPENRQQLKITADAPHLPAEGRVHTNNRSFATDVRGADR